MLFELAISLVTTFLAPVQNQQPSPKTQVIYVKESREPCTGVAPMECLQIKGVNDSTWGSLYTNIVGFKYIPGYRYKLKVKITQVKNPPADGSSVKYTLTKVLEKKKVQTARVSGNATQWASVAGKKWSLIKMGDTELTESNIWLEFDNATKRFHGKGGCNNVMGSYKAASDKITFSKAASTMMACSDEKVMQRESAFLQQIGDHTFNYEVTGQTLNLSENGKVVLTFSLQDKEDKKENAVAPDASQWAFIASKKWNVIKLGDSTLTQSGIWLEFDTDKKRFHGKGGCNSISGGYNATKDQITFTQAISTRMACMDVNIMRRESEFLKLIGGHTYRYDVADQTLNLYQNGKIVVMFGMQDK
ncbi:heat shock protein HslJ [Chitinophaga niastensis]|uniref:Heat shock protein HslJ n=1 Tax=Chitinophaga niastensis TaxID=536980 RepID=A0A2P8HSJ3_CHINA|nr:META domain-containing protein [Chitinophaga niastensis]PSL49196.1 heat shock protein HslJ [Chitinophaga niastensis]